MFICKILKDSKSAMYNIDDFECALIHSADNTDFGQTLKSIKIILFADQYGYKLICVDDWYNKWYKTYLGEDAIDKFLNF